MMELGAMVCTPQNPTCMLCPLRTHCQAFELGDPSAYPATAKRARQRPMTVQTAVISRPGALCADGEGDEFLVIKRPADGLLGGMWEFPSAEVDADSAAPNIQSYLQERLGISDAQLSEADELGEFVHHFSHIRMTIEVEQRRLTGRSEAVEPAADFDRPLQWVRREELETLAMSAAMRKVFALYESG
jgi:A/G-specific adenine glycosylase